MRKVIDIKKRSEVNFSSVTAKSAIKVAAHIMDYKHSLDLDMTLQELSLVNDCLFFLANAAGLSLAQLTGAPQVSDEVTLSLESNF